jgi:GGDEF domain-containing protein
MIHPPPDVRASPRQGSRALPLAERLRATCSRAAGAGAARVTGSVGVVTFERAPHELEELLTSADALM